MSERLAAQRIVFACRLAEDSAGNLWIASKGGLHLLNPNGPVFRHFTSQDGVQATEFHPGFKISTLAHAAQPAAALMTELRLAEHGLELIEPEAGARAGAHPDYHREDVVRQLSAGVEIAQFERADD